MPTVRSPFESTIEFDFTYRLTRTPNAMSRSWSAVGFARVTTFQAAGRTSGKSVVWSRTPPRTWTMSSPWSPRNSPRVLITRNAPFFFPFRLARARVQVDEVVVGEFLAAEPLRVPDPGAGRGLPVQGGLLVRVLPVAEVRGLREGEAQGVRQARPRAAGEVGVDRGVVPARVLE